MRGDMRGADMRGADMRGADMRGADMRGSDGGNPECGVNIPCTDPRCESDPHCHKPGQEICNNGIDDDDNGLIDCADPAAPTIPSARRPTWRMTCDDGHGGVDCNKPGCNTLPPCLHQTCTPEIEYGTLAPHDYDQTRTFDTRGATAEYATCAFPGGTARVGEFTVDGSHRRAARLQAAGRLGARHLDRARRLRPGVRREPRSPASRSGQAATFTHDAVSALPRRHLLRHRAVVPRHAGRDHGAPVDGPRQRDLRQRRRRRRQRPRRLRRPGLHERAQLHRPPSASPSSTSARSSSTRRAKTRRLRHARRPRTATTRPAPAPRRATTTSSASRCTRPPDFLCNGRKVTARSRHHHLPHAAAGRRPATPRR